MARTFLAGEAAVRLIPNAKNFHHSARRELAKDKISFAVNLTADATGFRREARERLKGTNLTVDVNLKPDVTGFSKEAKAKLDATRNLKVDVGLVANLDKRSIAEAHRDAQRMISAMGPIKVEVEARMDWPSVMDTHREMQTLMKRLGPIKVDVEANRSASDRLMGQRGGRGGGGGSSLYQKARGAAMGSAIVFGPIVTKAAVGGLTAIVAAASQAAGALGLLPAAAAAAGAGFAALGIGLSGIAGAFKALGKQQASGKSAVDNGKQAAQAARAVENASRGLAKAEKQVGRAQEEVGRAQLNLNRARKQAVRDLRDMNDQLRKAPINEKQAALAIQQAQKDLQDAYASGDQLQIQGAQLDLEEAKVDYDILIKQNQDLASDTAEANKAGVEGAQNVVDAKLAVRDANDQVADAQEAVLDAQDALTSAIENQTDALNKQAGGVDAVAEAFAKLSPNAQDFVRKMQALGPQWTDLRKAVQDRLFFQLGDSITTMANKQLPGLKAGLEGIALLLNGGIRQAIGVFSTDSAAADFTHSLANIQAMYGNIADSFAPLSRAFINVVTVGSDFLPRLGLNIAELSKKFADFTDRARADGSMQAFFERSIEMAKQLGRIIGNVGVTLGNFFKAGAETGGSFLDTIELVTGELRKFTESVEGQEQMKQFFVGVGEAVRTLAPIIQSLASLIFGTIGPALTDLVTAMGPGLVALFNGLADGLRAIAPVMKPIGEMLGQIATILGETFRTLGPIIAQTIQALLPAFQPLFLLFQSIITALAPVLPLIGQLVGSLVSALAPAFTKIVQALAPVISSLVTALMPVITPLAEMFGQFAGTLADALVPVINAMAPIFPMIAKALGDLLVALMPLLPPFADLAMQIIPPLVQIIEALMPVIQRVIEIFVDLVNYLVPVLIPILKLLSTIVGEVFRYIADIISWAIKNVVDPIIIAIGDTLRVLGTVFNWLWKEVVKPSFEAIGDVVKWVWDHVLHPSFDDLHDGLDAIGKFFSATVDGIEKAWGALARVAATPINWVIDNVINGGIGKGWKAVDNFLGNVLPDWTDVGHITIPGMATGGQVPMAPGAVAGKDSVLRNLMPGEIVMSLPAVKALGAANLLAANRAAQLGGGVDPQGLFPTNIAEMSQRVRSSQQYGMEDGGQVRPDDPAYLAIKKGMDWAQSRNGRPYVLGGSADGAGGTDCSGFMSGIADVILGGSGARQWATMAFNGGGNQQQASGPQGFQAGLAAGFAIGVTNGGEAGGHTAGTIGGFAGLPAVNVESGGSHGDVAYGGPAAGADDPYFNTHYHLPIVNGSFVGGGPGGTSYNQGEAQRRGITREVEKLLDGILSPVRGLIDQFGGPPPAIKGVPGSIYDHTVDPAKKWVLDKVSELTSVDGWRDKLKSTLDHMNPASWFDQGGVANGVGFMPKNTLAPERVLSPYETALFEGLLKVLGVFGLKTDQNKPIPVEVQNMPTTADTTGHPDAQTGQAYGQPLQGAAIDPKTGEYLPANNVPTGTTPDQGQQLFTNTPEWKTAKSFAQPFGLDKQMGKIEEKAQPLADLGAGIAKAAPAYAAALAGDPTQLLQNIATDTAAWAQKTTTDVATYLPENAGGIAESALSMLAGPLIGTVNTGMSQSQLVQTMEDVSNRQKRRSKAGRSRRG